MSKNILLNSPQVASAINTAQIASRLIDTDREIWASQGENSLALNAFAYQYAVLQAVVAQYQELLKRDLQAARQVHNELILSDLNLGSFWK